MKKIAYTTQKVNKETFLCARMNIDFLIAQEDSNPASSIRI